MKTRYNPTRPGLRLKPLVLSLALALGAGPAALAASAGPVDVFAEQRFVPDPTAPGTDPAARHRALMINMVKARTPPNRPAGAVAVTNCNNAGPGSLRNAYDSAVSGDLIDLGNLACSSITLTTGALVTAVEDLTIVGPENGGLIISGNDNSQVFVHLGQGTLTVSDLIVANGRKYNTGTDDALGGCIYSQGSVVMSQAVAKYCTAQTTGTGNARGGAIYGADSVLLVDSAVTGNDALSASGFATGGGVFTPGSFTSKYSTLQDNAALSSGSGAGLGGAVLARGNAFVLRSTVAENTADIIGGLDLTGTTSTTPLAITNSTISGNESLDSVVGAGVYLGENGTISNSTITGNVERNPADEKYGAGVTLRSGITATIQSSIVSGNTLFDGATSLPSDVGERGPSTLLGSNNVFGLAIPTPPAGSLLTLDPRLGPLASNGGPTQTHRPLKRSVAINAGSNPTSLPTDQRGSGFARSIGAGTDAGSFETDTLFYNGVEEP
jgi:hypothetical protein